MVTHICSSSPLPLGGGVSLLPGNVQATEDWGKHWATTRARRELAREQPTGKGKGAGMVTGTTAAVLKAKAALRAASAKGDDEWGWLPPVM
jgi:hypothetical protein